MKKLAMARQQGSGSTKRVDGTGVKKIVLQMQMGAALCGAAWIYFAPEAAVCVNAVCAPVLMPLCAVVKDAGPLENIESPSKE